MGGVSVWLGDRLFDEYHAGVTYTWARMRSAVCGYVWEELYEVQKAEWIARMDDPANLSSRVWVTYFEQVIELRYERYDGDTYHVNDYATFVIIANFDNFRRCCPDLDCIRDEAGTERKSCLPML